MLRILTQTMITNSTLASRHHGSVAEGDQQQNNRVRTCVTYENLYTQSFTHSVFPVALSVIFLLVYAKCNFHSVSEIVLGWF